MAPLGPFGPSPRLLVGVSGGPHSLALALLARDWARARGGALRALILDHGLRPGSAAEAAGVRTMLEGQGIPAEVQALSLPLGAGVQERARAARLGALLSACARHGAPWLLLGHHRDDQAETVLMRGLAGSGPAGLAGMAPVRAAAQALVLRPLLGLAPARLEAVVAGAGLVPVRDPSNRDPRFTRARLRAVLDPDGAAALAGAAARFAARREGREGEVAARLAAAASLHGEGFARLDLPALGQDRMAVAALAALLRVVAGRVHAPAEAAVAALLARGEGTLGGARLLRGGVLVREAAAIGPDLPALPGALWDGRFLLEGSGDPASRIGALGAAPGVPRPAWLPAAAFRALPAIRRDRALVAVPSLFYPSPVACSPFRITFAPGGGPAT